jgi:hypothetical protein
MQLLGTIGSFRGDRHQGLAIFDQMDLLVDVDFQVSDRGRDGGLWPWD